MVIGANGSLDICYQSRYPMESVGAVCVIQRRLDGRVRTRYPVQVTHSAHSALNAVPNQYVLRSTTKVTVKFLKFVAVCCFNIDLVVGLMNCKGQATCI